MHYHIRLCRRTTYPSGKRHCFQTRLPQTRRTGLHIPSRRCWEAAQLGKTSWFLEPCLRVHVMGDRANFLAVFTDVLHVANVVEEISLDHYGQTGYLCLLHQSLIPRWWTQDPRQLDCRQFWIWWNRRLPLVRGLQIICRKKLDFDCLHVEVPHWNGRGYMTVPGLSSLHTPNGDPFLEWTLRRDIKLQLVPHPPFFNCRRYHRESRTCVTISWMMSICRSVQYYNSTQPPLPGRSFLNKLIQGRAITASLIALFSRISVTMTISQGVEACRVRSLVT